jgi:SAM-dependent methyltransferase
MIQKNNYLNKIGGNDLGDFIKILIELNFDFNENEFRKIVLNTVRYLNGDRELRSSLRIMQHLENSWYKSLLDGTPDFSVYDNIYYLADTWVCWKMYSRKYIKSLLSIRNDIGKINSIVDLGCGIGYSTAAFKEIFGCRVIGTNIKDTSQWKVCEVINNGFELLDSFSGLGKIDFVFASEYFEHFERPVEHLSKVLGKLSPKFICFANTFNAKSIGHFNIYKNLKNNYSGLEMPREFTRFLTSSKYRKIDTNFWNNRPNLYMYEE